MCMWNTCVQVILLFLHAHITSIKTTIFCTKIVIVIVSNYISRKMSASHDIIMIEYNSKLPIRVLFCCFLCTVCSIVSDSLMLAIRVLFCSFLRTVFSDSLIRFIVFPHKIHSAFRLDRKTCEQHSHVFRLTGTATSHCGHTF